MVDLHLVSWNRPEMTELVIRTIARNTNHGDYHLTVADNGSGKEVQKMLDDLYDEGLINSLRLWRENCGLECARQNLLLRETATEYFVDIDNDCLPPKGWLEQQLELMQKYEDYAAISQRTQVMIGTGDIFEEADKNGDELVDFPHPGGSFRMMRTVDVLRVNGWNPPQPGRGAEERKVCGRLREAGYKTGFATNIKTLHLFGVRERTKERWGYQDGMVPAETGHSDISHPALTNGDDYNEVLTYCGKELTDRYFKC